MPYKRKRTSRVRVRRRRRTVRIPRRRWTNKITSLKRTTVNFNNGVGPAAGLPFIVQSGTAEVTGAILFILSDIPSVAEFTTIYDQYRIAKVKVEFLPTQNEVPIAYVGAATAGTSVAYTAQGRLLAALDFDNATAPTSSSALREYQSCREVEGYKKIKFYFTPHMALAAYQGVLVTGYANRKSMWIDSGSNAVQHFGVKWVMTQANGAAAPKITYDVKVTYYVLFRNTFG